MPYKLTVKLSKTVTSELDFIIGTEFHGKTPEEAISLIISRYRKEVGSQKEIYNELKEATKRANNAESKLRLIGESWENIRRLTNVRQ